MIDFNLPLDKQANIICAISAATKYEIPKNIFLAVVELEGGKPGQYLRNKNGTYDIGPLQFNSAYINTLPNVSFKDVEGLNNDCYPYDLAAWRIRQHIKKDNGTLYQKVANYHSKTPKYNMSYQKKLIGLTEKWTLILKANAFTYSEPVNQKIKYIPRTIEIRGNKYE